MASRRATSAATKRALRAVSAEEPPPAPAPVLTLAQAVETGDYLTILVAQRREIAESLPDERGPAKAALHRQLSIIAKEIEALNVKSRQEANEDGDLKGDQPWDEAAI